jgi:YD repeat-containing protein
VVQCAYTGGVLSSVTDASGRVLQVGYSGGRLTSVTDAEGRVWTLRYDANGRLIAVSDPLVNGVSYSTQFGYSGDNVVSITNRLGKRWSFAYGANNRFSSMTDPDNRTWSLGYEVPGGGLGGFRIQPNAIGVEPGDVVSVGVATDPTGVTERRGMNDLGEWRTFTDALGNQTQFEYDSAHNRIKVRVPSGAVWQYTYDARGNTLTVKDPLNNTTSYQYGSYDRVTLVQDPLGNQTHYGYDSRGNLVQVSDPLGNTTTYTVNGSGLVTAVTDPMGRVTQFTYDSTGNLTQVQDPLGNTTRYSYQCCRVTQRTDALGRVTTYSYDGWGRLVGIDYPQSADVWLQYDAEGRLVQSVDGTGTRTYSYDSWGRRVQQVSPAGTTTATYDGAGRLTSQTDVTGRVIQYQYDGAGRLVRVPDPTSWVQYTYNANSAVVREVYSNNTRVDYTYDSAGRVTSVQHRVHSTNALIVGYAVTYDGAGRVVRIDESPTNAVTTYQYDGAGRLLREERTVDRPYVGEYQYDASGNRTFARRVEGGVETHRGTYTYDGAGRLVRVVDAATNTTENYVWNADGTLASFPGVGYTRLLEYDEEGRLIRIRRDYGGGNVQLAYEYAYGFDGGRRWRKDYVNGVWTRYPCGVACGAGELVEQQKPLEGGSWATSALYLQGISLVRRNSEWHHFDPLGTAGVITNGSAQVVSNNLYDLFGVLRYQQGSAETPWRWRSTNLAEEWLVSLHGSFALPKVGLTAGGFLLRGIPIGVAICLIQAWREVNRPDFGRGFPEDIG